MINSKWFHLLFFHFGFCFVSYCIAFLFLSYCIFSFLLLACGASCSLLCCILSTMLLLMSVLHCYCFAHHLSCVHPFLVLFISISTEIFQSIQWHAWITKIVPCSSFPLLEHPYALHFISCIPCHVFHHVACALH